jgi:hypothetical protein
VATCQPLRDRPVLEGLGAIIIASLAQYNALKVSVVNFDFTAAKVCDVEEPLSANIGSSGTLVDGTVRPAVIGVVYFQDGVDGRGVAACRNVDGWIAAADGAVFRGENDCRFPPGVPLSRMKSVGLPLKASRALLFTFGETL